jgi:hypothetical protein
VARLGSQLDLPGELLDRLLDGPTEVGLIARMGFRGFPNPTGCLWGMLPDQLFNFERCPLIRHDQNCSCL